MVAIHPRILGAIALPQTELRGVSRYADDAAPPLEREWFVYFLQGDDGGPIKIGRTQNNVRWRIGTLQEGYPFGKLRLVGVIVGRYELETQLHEKFKPLWVRGEWFRPDPELLDYIAGLERVP